MDAYRAIPVRTMYRRSKKDFTTGIVYQRQNESVRLINNHLMNSFLKGATLFLGGALVGAAAIILLAPKAGEEARQQLADLAEKAKKQAEEYCHKTDEAKEDKNE